MKTITTEYPSNEALTEGHKFYPYPDPVENYCTDVAAWLVCNGEVDCHTRRIVFDALSTGKDGWAENVERYELVNLDDDCTIAFAVFVDGTCELRGHNPDMVTPKELDEWFDHVVMVDPIREIRQHHIDHYKALALTSDQ
jgi:hypothetical protein